MSILLDGRKIGSMHTTRTVQGEHVTTLQTMSFELERSGIKLSLSTSERDEETVAGKPLGFESRTKISGIETVVHGTVKADGKIEVVSEVGGAQKIRTIDWPKQALLAEGLRRAEQSAGLKRGTHYRSLAFQVEDLTAVEVDSVVGEPTMVDLPDGRHELVRIEQTEQLPGAPTHTIAWLDNDYNIAKLTLPVMGYELTMLACSQACAEAPNQSTDLFVHTLVPAPRALSAEELPMASCYGLMQMAQTNRCNSRIPTNNR